MSSITLEQARELLDVVIGPEEIVAKVPEFKFGGKQELLTANGLSSIPALPPKEKILIAKEQKKALIFRVAKDGTGQEINLAFLKERFGGLIYSTWYLHLAAPFAREPLVTGWALADLDPMPGSAEKTYKEQQEFAKEKGVRLKSVVADVYDLLVAYKVTGKFFREAPLNARTAVIFNKEPVKISHFDKGGMCISTGWGGSVKHAEIGATTEMLL